MNDEFKVWLDKMPEDCFGCPCDSDYYSCNLTGYTISYDDGKRRDDCPLKLISEYAKEQEHGRGKSEEEKE